MRRKASIVKYEALEFGIDTVPYVLIGISGLRKIEAEEIMDCAWDIANTTL